MVQIEESELATLRRERDEAKRQAETLSEEKRTLTTKAEAAEAAQKRAEDERDAERTQRTQLEEQAQKAALASRRMGTLGAGFLGKLGETSKTVLTELAGNASDEQWDLALKEREELAGVKRDAQPNGSSPEGVGNGTGSFETEEVASFLGRVGSQGTDQTPDGVSSVRKLARTFAKSPRR
jgi:hypothetical protein